MVTVCSNVDCGFKFWQNSKPSACVVLANTDGRVLLVTRKIEPHKGKLDLPGGFLQEGEHPIAGAIRELQEELDVKISITDFLGFVPDRYLYQDINYWVLDIGFVATITTGTPNATDDVAGFDWYDPRMVARSDLALDSNAEFLRRFVCMRDGQPVALLY